MPREAPMDDDRTNRAKDPAQWNAELKAMIAWGKEEVERQRIAREQLTARLKAEEEAQTKAFVKMIAEAASKVSETELAATEELMVMAVKSPEQKEWIRECFARAKKKQ